MSQTIRQRDELGRFAERRNTSPRLIVAPDATEHNKTDVINAIRNILTNQHLSNERAPESAESSDGRGPMVLVAELILYGWLLGLIAWAVLR